MDKTKNEFKDTSIQQLIKILGSKKGMERKKARKILVEKGSDVINPLVDLLDHPKHVIRWEAMMTLKEIGDQSLIPLFISKLDDDESDIRWIASEGLVKLGTDVVNPLLKILMEKPDSVFILAGAHHIFSDLHKNKNLPPDFPFEKIMPLLKITSLAEKLIVTVNQISDELNKPKN